jgi:HPt (histidine-containing phosphotransfer) domain-containing protein
MNQSKQIVAIDPQILAKVGAADPDAFYKQIALGETTFALDGNTLTITSVDGTYTYVVKQSSLSGILGDLTLVDIEDETEKSSTISSAGDDILSMQTEKAEPEEEPLLSFDDSDLFEIKNNEEEDHSKTEESKEEPAGDTESSHDELFELLLPEDADSAIEQIAEKEQAPSELAASQNAPIYIDIEGISKKIGISPDDYNLFLNEYIDTALALEKALQGNHTGEQTEALNKLSHLSNVLHLPFVDDLLKQIEHASDQERDDYIASFFSTLGRLSTTNFEEEMSILGENTSNEKSEETSKDEIAEVLPSATQREPIDLSNVKPIHFDFQLEAAAEDLSLPVELIEEFVRDFIQQAHEETQKMLAAYEKGDLETVQKIGHLLKGTSSNLRINPLSDTLYEIQFNEDIERVPELVKNYWAHFLSLENQFKLITNK